MVSIAFLIYICSNAIHIFFSLGSHCLRDFVCGAVLAIFLSILELSTAVPAIPIPVLVPVPVPVPVPAPVPVPVPVGVRDK